MKGILKEIAELTTKATTEPTKTELPGILIIKGEVSEHQLAAIYEPMIGLVVQGSKTISIGEQTIHLPAPSYFVISADVPATGKVQQGKEGPYISIGLQLDQDSIADLLNDLSKDLSDENHYDEFCACDADSEYLEPWLRMLNLLKTPKHIPALAPVYRREILFRTLLGPQGWRLKQLCQAQGKGPSVYPAIQWIRENYTASMEIKRLAAKSRLAVTTFHRQFKQITGLSPVQFQKQLRLLEARKLLVYSAYSASRAAYEVGYESVSQFNREYSRFFGDSPVRDASNVREKILLTNP
ncbi:AraC family transcriptional regulator [Leptospira sarikeiensis]|uniref:AraC family transcriptional regulator n=1 Tax=Leptospira sarikeiensis TaxID=2484943 RepID=A0A4R9K2T7_9LEPT|nr:AraC family transcriptional regulator [Leptospira sarikeiensis]TGL58467.1 AraC family transcriptional regulator [Leptospira sarikeiensis]